MAAARQNEMNDNMTVVATTTLVVVDLDAMGNDSVNAKLFLAIRGLLKDYMGSAIFRHSSNVELSLQISMEGAHGTWPMRLSNGYGRSGHAALPRRAAACAICCWAKTPKDFDVATSARPEELLRLFPGADQVGAHFGVVLVHEDVRRRWRWRRSAAISDTRTGGIRWRCEFETDPRQDVLRRDFTINALLMDPASGEILDFVGGRADLEARVIRAIGDPEARFREDHLRLLRAVRFAARLGFEIEAETFAAMRRLARVDPERGGGAGAG